MEIKLVSFSNLISPNGLFVVELRIPIELMLLPYIAKMYELEKYSKSLLPEQVKQFIERSFFVAEIGWHFLRQPMNLTPIVLTLKLTHVIQAF